VLLRSTGSALSPERTAAYRATAASPAHVRATLAMMANWDLRPLAERLPDVDIPVALATGDRDEWTSARQLAPVAARMPRASLTVVPNAGHLLHEELPAFAARFVLAAAERAGIVTADGATAAASTP